MCIRQLGLLVMALFVFGGCYSEPEERLSSRLGRFLDLLSAGEVQYIAGGLYTQAAASLAGRVQQDADLAKNYHNILAAEDIPFFNYNQAVRYFAGSLDGRIRFLRFVKILEEPELLSFNKGQSSDTAAMLFARFEKKPRLAKDYADTIAPKRKRMNDQEIADVYIWTKCFLPFSALYMAMSASERTQLVDGEITQAARSLAAKRGTDPRVQQSLELIRYHLPETRALEYPEMVFEAAALRDIQDKAMRRSLAILVGGFADGKESGALLNQAKALGVAFPVPTERQKRLEELEGDIAWFKDFVDEKLDFYTN
ncbi:MAG: hypothetical protein LBC99_06785 [Spirochaetota bacterium]|jgi:hypothetical protein|nr:hypothetical protein [Spirochaetota bacterium]